MFIPNFVFGFWVTFGDDVTKIQKSLFTFYKARWARRKKTERKINQLPKYQKPKDENMG